MSKPLYADLGRTRWTVLCTQTGIAVEVGVRFYARAPGKSFSHRSKHFSTHEDAMDYAQREALYDAVTSRDRPTFRYSRKSQWVHIGESGPELMRIGRGDQIENP